MVTIYAKNKCITYINKLISAYIQHVARVGLYLGIYKHD